MVCHKCKSPHVIVQMQEVGAKTSKRGNGILGNTNNTMRAVTGMFTFGNRKANRKRRSKQKKSASVRNVDTHGRSVRTWTRINGGFKKYSEMY